MKTLDNFFEKRLITIATLIFTILLVYGNARYISIFNILILFVIIGFVLAMITDDLINKYLIKKRILFIMSKILFAFIFYVLIAFIVI